MTNEEGQLYYNETMPLSKGVAISDERLAEKCEADLANAQAERDALRAQIETLREALEKIFSRISYINIHGVGEQPEQNGLPQIVRCSPTEFKRIWKEMGDIARAALAATEPASPAP